MIPIVFTLALLNGQAQATTPVQNSVSTSQAVLRLNAKSVAAFADREFSQAMRAGRIPGAVFVAVNGNQVVFQNSYGFADLLSRKPVSVTNTLFRVASLSKIFTAAAVLQLVHEHLLNLNRSVNRYAGSITSGSGVNRAQGAGRWLNFNLS